MKLLKWPFARANDPQKVEEEEAGGVFMPPQYYYETYDCYETLYDIPVPPNIIPFPVESIDRSKINEYHD